MESYPMPTSLRFPMHPVTQLHTLPHIRRRHNIQHTHRTNTFRKVQRQSIGEATASVVSKRDDFVFGGRGLGWEDGVDGFEDVFGPGAFGVGERVGRDGFGAETVATRGEH